MEQGEETNFAVYYINSPLKSYFLTQYMNMKNYLSEPNENCVICQNKYENFKTYKWICLNCEEYNIFQKICEDCAHFSIFN